MGEISGRVTCKLCERTFKILTDKHMRGAHGITLKDYKERFPGAEIAGQYWSTMQTHKEHHLFNKTPIDTAPPSPSPVEMPATDNDLIVDDMDIAPDSQEDLHFNVAEKFPEIEELDLNTPLDIEEAVEESKLLDPEGLNSKKSTFLFLKTIYPTVVADFNIQKFFQGKHLQYQYITDIADPINKIDFEFPDTYWHNEGPIDLMRDTKLRANGWKIVTVKGMNPTSEKIRNALEKEFGGGTELGKN